MKKIIFLFAALSFIACKKDSENSDKKSIAENLKSYSIEQMMDNESVFGGSFSPDKSKVLVTSNRSGIFNMYTVDTNSGDYRPITASDSSSVFAISYFPEDERILFRMDNNGDEVFHIYMQDTDGTSKELTPGEGARSVFYGWAHDGKSFFYGSNKRDARYMDVYKMGLGDLEAKLIYQNDEGYGFGGISNDQNHMALSKSINTNDSDLFIYNFADKSLTKINENLSGNSPQDFSPDNKSLYFTTDDGAEFAYLVKYNLEDKSREKVMEKSWDITGSYFTHGGKYQVTFVNEDAQNAIEVTEVATGNPMDLSNLEDGNITNVGFSRDEKMMTYYLGGSHTPSNLYTYDIENGASKKMSDVLNKEINAEDMVKARVIRFKSFDGLEIPAIYYLPHQASADNPVPAMVWVHGGPGGQSRQNFSSFIQYMVNHGYAVLAVNNRGSSGYGKSFYRMDDLNHGDKDLKDCVEGKNWLAEQAEIDGEKIGIIGGSYGGYMTMAALTYAPEEFDVGVNLFGVTNWIRTLRSIPPWWESFKDALYKELGDPYSADSVRLREISPLFHTQRVTKPLIVLQGAKDPRVLKIESDEIVAGVKKNGVPVEYVLFEDEGHGFVKKENQIEAYSKVLKFLDTYLKKTGDLETNENEPKKVSE
ncbi:alpha/beta fold hydrolase [Leptobacterium flavescens]|uniref:Alpha/beta fold hydrolase n=1 Tax=Leptobacterium flavescens TaxID=472055 RepID=A0A6P0ULL7_9FLAO|nr:alpha/beta fold hydrolase [Leptobacterium flavescens]NER14124.1 alpha/beta fold hydrolase [Leptobacterium flavescens]